MIGLPTPWAAVDADILERNLRAMADGIAARGLALRPHGKTHKCVEIARRQIALGASGLTVATVREAEVFADGGIDDLFIAYPVWPSAWQAARLRELAGRVALRAGVDSVESADRHVDRGQPVGAAGHPGRGQQDAGRALRAPRHHRDASGWRTPGSATRCGSSPTTRAPWSTWPTS
jgi:D-serine deaminase-like pyridoxal phosphate-dependent protein